MGMIEKHELTLSFNTSEEMWQFVKETHTIDKIVGVEDYKHWYKGDMCGVGGDNPLAWMPLPYPFEPQESEET